MILYPSGLCYQFGTPRSCLAANVLSHISRGNKKNWHEPADFVKARLHQVSASMLWQLCDDANNPFLIEKNGVTPEWGCNPFSSDSIVLNKNRIGSVIAEWS